MPKQFTKGDKVKLKKGGRIVTGIITAVDGLQLTIVTEDVTVSRRHDEVEPHIGGDARKNSHG